MKHITQNSLRRQKVAESGRVCTGAYLADIS